MRGKAAVCLDQHAEGIEIADIAGLEALANRVRIGGVVGDGEQHHFRSGLARQPIGFRLALGGAAEVANERDSELGDVREVVVGQFGQSVRAEELPPAHVPAVASRLLGAVYQQPQNSFL